MTRDLSTLLRLADSVGSPANPATVVFCSDPPRELSDNGGAQCRLIHSDEWQGVVLADGTRHELKD